MLNPLSLLSDAWILLKQQQKIIVNIGIQSIWMALVGHSLFSTSSCSYLVVCEVTKYSIFGYWKVKRPSYNWEHSICYCFPWSFLSTALCSEWSSHMETSSHLKAWLMIYFSFTDSLKHTFLSQVQPAELMKSTTCAPQLVSPICVVVGNVFDTAGWCAYKLVIACSVHLLY